MKRGSGGSQNKAVNQLTPLNNPADYVFLPLLQIRNNTVSDQRP